MTMQEAAKTLGLDIEKPDPADKTPCAGLAYAIATCTPYDCTRKHDTIKNYTIAHAVLGKSTNGKFCHHQQTAPDGQIIDCNYTPAMQIIIARMTLSKSRLDKAEQDAISESFKKQCRLLPKPAGQ